MSRSFFVDDSIVTVDQVLLDLVRKHALNWLDTELSADLCDDSGHFSVSGSLLDGPLGGLHCVVSGQDGICLASSNLISANNNSSGSDGSIPVNVGTSGTKFLS